MSAGVDGIEVAEAVVPCAPALAARGRWLELDQRPCGRASTGATLIQPSLMQYSCTSDVPCHSDAIRAVTQRPRGGGCSGRPTSGRATGVGSLSDCGCMERILTEGLHHRSPPGRPLDPRRRPIARPPCRRTAVSGWRTPACRAGVGSDRPAPRLAVDHQQVGTRTGCSPHAESGGAATAGSALEQARRGGRLAALGRGGHVAPAQREALAVFEQAQLLAPVARRPGCRSRSTAARRAASQRGRSGRPSPRLASVLGHSTTPAPLAATASISAGVACVACTSCQRASSATCSASHSIGRRPVAATQSSTSAVCSATWMWIGPRVAGAALRQLRDRRRPRPRAASGSRRRRRRAARAARARRRAARARRRPWWRSGAGRRAARRRRSRRVRTAPAAASGRCRRRRAASAPAHGHRAAGRRSGEPSGAWCR